jgi:hypothetical protein
MRKRDRQRADRVAGLRKDIAKGRLISRESESSAGKPKLAGDY